MKILLINYEYPPIGGGGAAASQALVHAWLDRGHSVCILTSKIKGLKFFEKVGGKTLIRIPALRFKADQASFVQILAFLVMSILCVIPLYLWNRPQVCFAFFSLPSGPAAWVGKLFFNVPYVVALRGADVPGTEKSKIMTFFYWFTGPIRRVLLRGAKAVTANAEDLKLLTEKIDGIHVEVIPNASVIEVKPKTDLLGPRKEKARLLFVGRFKAQKNLFYLFRAFAEALKNLDSTLELHLVGDGEERSALEELAKKLQISKSIFWHGWLSRDKVMEQYHQADVLIIPSHYEGHSNVGLDAMAIGVPVLASKVTGNVTLLRDQVTGALYEPDNTQSFIQCLSRLLKDPAFYITIQKGAQDEIQQKPNWSQLSQNFLDLFSKPAGRI